MLAMANCCGGSKPIVPGSPGTILPGGTVVGQFIQVVGGAWTPSSYPLQITLAGGEVGQVLTVYGDDIATFETPIDKGLFYRIASQNISNTALFLNQWTTGSAAQATIGAAGYANALITGTLKWFRISHSTPVVDVEDITYTVVINGADSSVVLTLNTSSAGPVDDLVSTIAVNAGDLISVRADGATAARSIKPALDFFLV
jgi:hypothetical protein